MQCVFTYWHWSILHLVSSYSRWMSLFCRNISLSLSIYLFSDRMVKIPNIATDMDRFTTTAFRYAFGNSPRC